LISTAIVLGSDWRWGYLFPDRLAFSYLGRGR
jgi:hypothetical protein